MAACCPLIPKASRYGKKADLTLSGGSFCSARQSPATVASRDFAIAKLALGKVYHN